jgi:hypothetical protein
MWRLMKVWGIVSAVALLGLCEVNVVATILRVSPAPRLRPAVPANLVMRQEQRMADLRRAMQTRGVRGTLGYLTDVAAADLAMNPRGMEEYFLTQFALVPWILEVGAQGGEWLVANLHVTPIGERTPSGYRVIDDCGDGVFLLQRTEHAAP